MRQGTYKRIEVSKLKFDPGNPRLPSTYGSADESRVLKYMLFEENLLELLTSIVTQGFFEGEPLLVVKSLDETYRVVEGNRRLAAIKLINNPDLAPVKKIAVSTTVSNYEGEIFEVACLVYERREDILDYLGYRHITGVQEWDSLAKGRYLKQLYDTELSNGTGHKATVKLIAKKIGSNPSSVQKIVYGIFAYDTIQENDFYNIKSLNEESFEFSLLTTALSYAKINNFVLEGSSLTEESIEDKSLLNSQNLADLTKWIFDKNSENQSRIGESRNLKTLNSVLAYPNAITAFKNGSTLSDAALLTDVPEVVFRKLLRLAESRLSEASKLISEVQIFSDNDTDSLLKIATKAKDLIAIVQGRQEAKK